MSIERSRFDLRDYFWTGTLGVLASLAQLVVVLFTTFFLLSSGSTFRRKMVSLAGPRFAGKRITVQVLDEITEQIRRYLLIQILTSALVGLVIWLAFLAVGVERAAVWGLVAFALNFVPFLGTIVLVTASAMVAFVQFGTLNHVLLVAGLALCIHTVAANVLAPWLASRTGRVNAVCVFVGVIAFGWLWGIWGLVLGVPCLTAIKAVCDRVQDLKPIGELLGN